MRIRRGFEIVYPRMTDGVSRYDLLTKLASGGMGTVYVGRVRGPLGFSRLVAIKRAHPHLADDPLIAKMLIEEAKLASRITHPHVVSVLDVERVKNGVGADERKEIRLVMDYVEGGTLIDLAKLAGERETSVPAAVAVRIVLDAAAGLQAAHELTDDAGAPLGIVHRDVSPHNILVGVDGMARVSDFGIAKATFQPGQTSSGDLKGKLAYMAPEYVEKSELDVRSDVFSLGVVAWETLAKKRLFKGSGELDTLQLVAAAKAPLVSAACPELGTALDDVVAKALRKVPAERYSSARDFATALEAAARPAGLVATHADVAAFVKEMTKEMLEPRRVTIRERMKELDAKLPAVATVRDSDGKIRAAIEAAARMAPPSALAATIPDTRDPPPPDPDRTLDGTGTTGRVRHPRRGPPTWVYVGVAGATALVTAGAIHFARRAPAEDASDAAMLIAIPTARTSAAATTPTTPTSETSAGSAVSAGAPSASTSAAPTATPTGTVPVAPRPQAAPFPPKAGPTN